MATAGYLCSITLELRLSWRDRPLLPPLLLALLWGLAPVLPALLRGELAGHPFTDLYPSVWGLWGFVEAQPGLPGRTDLLGFPDGMGFYYSSPLKGWLAWPLVPVIGLPATWNLLLVLARVGTVLASWAAARAWGFGLPGALAAAATFGASPFFHGYAVEGIVEGTDGWTLALWAWAVGRRRWRLSALFFGLTVLSSWYLGMVVCLLALLAGLWQRRAWWSFGGLAFALPGLWTFARAFPGAAPLDDVVRVAMGAALRVPTPGLVEGTSLFAINTYVGWLVLAAALAGSRRWSMLAILPALLSLGRGPIYELPVAELVRFPYRWHAGTLLLLSAAVAACADRWRLAWLGPAIALEGLLLSPVEPVLPGAPAEIPAIYARVDAPLLEVPGPVARPPGERNPSRPRARYLLYYQTAHRQPSPWVPDFNSVGVVTRDAGLDALRIFDPVESRASPELADGAVADLSALGVVWLMVQRAELGPSRARRLLEGLQTQGASLVAVDEARWLLRLPVVREPAAR